MANPNAPFGLLPVRSLVSGNTIQTNEYVHDVNYATALFIGDPVITVADPANTSGQPPYFDGTPAVQASGTITTTAIRGAVVGVRPTFSNLTLQYAAASVEASMLVCDDPMAIFRIMSNGTAVADDIGDNMGITTGTGSTVTGLSAYVATESTGHADNAYVLRILRLAPIVNNLLGANSVFEVKANIHELLNSTTPA